MRDLVGPRRVLRESAKYGVAPGTRPHHHHRVAHPFLSRLVSPRLAGVARHGALGFASLAFPWRRTTSVPPPAPLAASSYGGAPLPSPRRTLPPWSSRAPRDAEKRAPRRRGRRRQPRDACLRSPSAAVPSARRHGSLFPVALSILFL